MFKFQDLKQIHLEITNRCQASCPMCSRNHHGGLENPLIKNQDWTLEDFQKILTQEVLNQLDSFYFCGNFGDPIINNDLLEMVEYSAKTNPHVYIRIHTNGSARTEEWWAKLAKVMPKTHNVIFAIDGLEDTHSIYRIGTKYETIMRNAKAFINSGGSAEWAFIKFKHNEHQIEKARKLAKKHGFSRFTYKDSSRFVATDKFEVYDKQGNVDYYLEPPTGSSNTYITKEVMDNYKDIVAASEIDCYVKRTKEIYIDAYKNILPCCFLASVPFNYSGLNDIARNIKTEIEDQYKNLILDLGNTNGLKHSIKEVIDSTEWQTVWDKYWNEQKLIICARTCGKNTLTKPAEQIVRQIDL